MLFKPTVAKSRGPPAASPRLTSPPVESVAPGHPVSDQHNLFGRQSLIVPKSPEAFHRTPRRHPALQNFLLDGLRPRPRVVVRRDGKRASTFAMADGAARVDDANNLPVESD